MKLLLGKQSRTLGFRIILIFSVVGIIARLFQLQIIDHQKYVKLAHQEQVKKLKIPAKRGIIYGFDNDSIVPFVMNETVFLAFVDPQILKPEQKDKLKTAFGKLDQSKMVGNLDKKIDFKESRYQVIAQNLTKAEAELIKAEKLTGVGFTGSSKRVYLENELGSQLLGFVNANGGQYGIESYLEKRLIGRDGILEAVTDAADIPLTLFDKYINIPAQDGDDVVLTIDRNIQDFTEKALEAGVQKAKADKGSVIIMDPNSGRVLAMANYPSYSASNFSEIKDMSLFNNPAVDEPYEVGSVMKAFTVAMGINEDKITANSEFYNKNFVKIRGAENTPINNAVKGKIGNVTMQYALTNSLNTGMIDIIRRLGGGRVNSTSYNIMYDYYHNKFRFGQKTGIELNESPGIIVSPDKLGGDTMRYPNMSFGHGMDLTMIQLVSGFSALINGGTYYKPSVIAGTLVNNRLIKQESTIIAKNIIKKSTSDELRTMLSAVRRQTTPNVDKLGYEIGTKSGTSEKLVDGKYTKKQTIATFLGYGGNNTPKYVIMVKVDGNRNLIGMVDAAPIFTNISNWLINYLKIYPKE